MKRFLKLRTLYGLGVSNLVRVGIYRLGLKSRFHPVLKLTANASGDLFFHQAERTIPAGAIARDSWTQGSGLFFGRRLEGVKEPPDWNANAFKPEAQIAADRPWWRIPDFNTDIGDIKTIWEASRFDWLIAMAERAALGKRSELDRLNQWLASWCKQNPPYFGANWKCGQEASIRVLHLMLATLILGQAAMPNPALINLVRLHLARIAPTMSYAIGQSNNHGTSEAAALFVGGAWLLSQGDKKAGKWLSAGRRWLENRAKVLIGDDGSFSQYSVTYHRLMLDTYSFSEVWRRKFSLEPFPKHMTDKLSAATDWLGQLTDAETGDAPNFGANDGAQILKLVDTDYRDFRPSVQLANALFKEERAYAKDGLYNQPFIWLGINIPEKMPGEASSATMDDGGLHVLRYGGNVAYMRYPRFRFRPSHADALHCDVWVGGKNIARDDGTHSYLTIGTPGNDFGRTRMHNTVEFDDRDQMPRLGRFLFGAWLGSKDVSTAKLSGKRVSATAAYRDWQGAYHKRTLQLESNRLICTDQIEGYQKRAILRWRLAPGEWRREENLIRNDNFCLSVKADVPVKRIELVQGVESRYYMEKSTLPVLEVEVETPGTITSEFNF